MGIPYKEMELASSTVLMAECGGCTPGTCVLFRACVCTTFRAKGKLGCRGDCSVEFSLTRTNHNVNLCQRANEIVVFCKKL